MLRPFFYLASVVVLANVWATASAEPARCVKDGRTIITDMPCSALGAADKNPKPVPSQFVPLPPRYVAPQEQLAPPPISAPVPKAEQLPSVQNQFAASQSTAMKIAMSSLYQSVGFALAVLIVFAILKRKTKAALKRWGSSLLKVEDLLQSRRRVDETAEELPYKPGPLMSRYELEFFSRLRSALPECEVFPQVPLSAFIRIDRKKAGRSYFQNSYRWQNRIGQQRVDFLICDRESMGVLAAVELDDPSHDNEEAEGRDQKKDKSLGDAGIRLLRWRVEAMPSEQDIRATWQKFHIQGDGRAFGWKQEPIVGANMDLGRI